MLQQKSRPSYLANTERGPHVLLAQLTAEITMFFCQNQKFPIFHEVIILIPSNPLSGCLKFLPLGTSDSLEHDR